MSSRPLAGSVAVALLSMATALPSVRAGEAGPQPPSPADDRFRRADRNGDGVLTPDEVRNPDLFKRLDRDGDGRVTPEEARAAAAGRGTDPAAA